MDARCNIVPVLCCPPCCRHCCCVGDALVGRKLWVPGYGEVHVNKFNAPCSPGLYITRQAAVLPNADTSLLSGQDALAAATRAPDWQTKRGSGGTNAEFVTHRMKLRPWVRTNSLQSLELIQERIRQGLQPECRPPVQHRPWLIYKGGQQSPSRGDNAPRAELSDKDTVEKLVRGIGHKQIALNLGDVTQELLAVGGLPMLKAVALGMPSPAGQLMARERPAVDLWDKIIEPYELAALLPEPDLPEEPLWGPFIVTVQTRFNAVAEQVVMEDEDNFYERLDWLFYYSSLFQPESSENSWRNAALDQVRDLLKPELHRVASRDYPLHIETSVDPVRSDLPQNLYLLLQGGRKQTACVCSAFQKSLTLQTHTCFGLQVGRNLSPKKLAQHHSGAP